MDTRVSASNAAHDLRQIGANPNFWYPLAWSSEVRKGKAFAAQFAGEPIAIFRQDNGDIFALEDRCAHRQVPLSKGTLTQCGVRCCYHGWTYDASGKCVDVPYLGKGKLPNGVRAYPCCERDGVILIWPGSQEAATPPQALGAAGDAAYKTRRFGRVVRCHYTFMHENLMDMNHQFLHQRTTGRVKPRYLDRRSGDGFIELDYSFNRDAGERPPLGLDVIAGRVRGEAMSRNLMTIRTEYPYQTLRHWISGEAPVLSVWLGYTPVDREQRLNRTFIVLSVRRPKVPLLLDAAWPVLAWFTNRVFAEDCDIVEMEQAAYDSQGGDWNQEVFPPIRELRRLLAANGVPMMNVLHAAE
ncbi:MAG: aromatic ring-hydroxylating dioxygenase subunit alpha [Candidatus Binataceae bacterium]|jgi:phenylpropionate dioxygenase-like ring-hydroxylating dioxygenase large terminal subunit